MNIRRLLLFALALAVGITPELLPAIVQAVQGACPVLVDGGIRRGTDIVKALAH